MEEYWSRFPLPWLSYLITSVDVLALVHRGGWLEASWRSEVRLLSRRIVRDRLGCGAGVLAISRVELLVDVS